MPLDGDVQIIQESTHLLSESFKNYRLTAWWGQLFALFLFMGFLQNDRINTKDKMYIKGAVGSRKVVTVE
jgi:hypothetical protein